MVVAPLGIVAIAANSFAIIAESLCYMPGYGISEAATTLVGQSLGANRIRLLRRFANITVWSGMLIMGVMGALIYVAAPQIIGVMTPVEEIRTLGIEILRIEAFAEPMFAASIVAYGEVNVPITTPRIIANAKLRILSPPNTKIHNNTINVLNEVLIVRANVVFSESLNSKRLLRFGYKLKNSRTRSKITTLSLIE